MRQEADTASVEAVAKFAQAVAPRLPPAALIQALAAAFPGMNLDQVQMPDDGAQEPQAPDGWNIKRGIRWGLATDEQYQKLAREYFDNNRGLPVRFWSETQPGQVGPVFSRPQFDTLLAELVRAGMAVKDEQGITRLNASGEGWLRMYKI